MAGDAYIQLVGGFAVETAFYHIVRILDASAGCNDVESMAGAASLGHFLAFRDTIFHDPHMMLVGKTSFHANGLPAYRWKVYREGWYVAVDGEIISCGKVCSPIYERAESPAAISRDQIVMTVEERVWGRHDTRDMLKAWLAEHAAEAPPKKQASRDFEVRFFVEFATEEEAAVAFANASKIGCTSEHVPNGGIDSDEELLFEVILTTGIPAAYKTFLEAEATVEAFAEAHGGEVNGHEMELPWLRSSF